MEEKKDSTKKFRLNWNADLDTKDEIKEKVESYLYSKEKQLPEYVFVRLQQTRMSGTPDINPLEYFLISNLSKELKEEDIRNLVNIDDSPGSTHIDSEYFH